MKDVFLALGLCLLISGCEESAPSKKTAEVEAPPGEVNSTTTEPRCDQVAARKALATMTDPRMASITEEIEPQSGTWVVVRFGPDYAGWTPQALDSLVTAYANVDACIAGKARRMEFRAPSGKVVARADEVYGIKIY